MSHQQPLVSTHGQTAKCGEVHEIGGVEGTTKRQHLPFGYIRRVHAIHQQHGLHPVRLTRDTQNAPDGAMSGRKS